MKKKLKILMVDDHPMIIEGYKNALLDKNHFSFRIDSANSCSTALEKFNLHKENPYNLYFLDIQIPPCDSPRILSGEDLGMYIKKEQPDAKIIILTMFNESLRLQNILKNLDPEAFLVKSDVTPAELLKAVEVVSNGGKYYSESIQNLRQVIGDDKTLDDYDRKILFYLSKGTKTKDLVNYVPLSIGAIEKRKRKIKDVFDITDGGDKAILEKAESLGYL